MMYSVEYIKEDILGFTMIVSHDVPFFWYTLYQERCGEIPHLFFKIPRFINYEARNLKSCCSFLNAMSRTTSFNNHSTFKLLKFSSNSHYNIIRFNHSRVPEHSQTYIVK